MMLSLVLLAYALLALQLARQARTLQRQQRALDALAQRVHDMDRLARLAETYLARAEGDRHELFAHVRHQVDRIVEGRGER
jgi:hypothetical protein